MIATIFVVTRTSNPSGISAVAGIRPIGVAITPDGMRTYATHHQGGSDSVVDFASRRTIGSIVAVDNGACASPGTDSVVPAFTG